MKNLRRLAILVMVLVSALLVNNVFADVESVRGALVEIAAPASVAQGALENNNQIVVFEESADLALPQDLTVDVRGYNRFAKKLRRGTEADIAQLVVETKKPGQDSRDKKDKKDDRDNNDKDKKNQDKNDKGKKEQDKNDKGRKEQDKNDKGRKEQDKKNQDKNDKGKKEDKKQQPGKNKRELVLDAGTIVNSYLIHLDPVGTKEVRLQGCVRFDTKVLGLIVGTKALNATDAMLGNPGTVYSQEVKARGLDALDVITIRKGNRVVCMSFRAAPYMDQVRVITEPNESSGGGSSGDENLVGHWMLDETAGSVAADSSPSANDGSLIGNPAWTAGQIGGALALDGAGDGVAVLDPEELHDLDTMSVSMWFNANTVGQDGKGTFMAKDDSFAIRFSNTNHRVFFSAKRWDGGTGSWRFHTVANDSLLGGWHHLVFTYDYSSEANVPLAYLDGVLMAFENTAIPMPPVGSEAGDFYIGNDSSGDYAFDGLMDDVRVYNDILTPAEVLALGN